MQGWEMRDAEIKYERRVLGAGGCRYSPYSPRRTGQAPG